MHLSPIVLTAAILLGLATTAGAQSNPGPGAAAAEPAPSQAGQSEIDIDRLPVDLSRIQRALRQSSIREERDGLRLRYFIDVYGQAPRIELFTRQDNLLNGPVPYGAPTHNEILEHITPREYRAPAADFSALIRWFSDKAKK